MEALLMDNRPIGVFDSGLGGVSVLKTFVEMLPDESFVYYGDNKNAPYGEKTKQQIADLSADCCRFLQGNDVKAIVIACNTATAASIERLETEFETPILGMEPAVREADKVDGDGKILVMATRGTLSLERYNERVKELGLVGHTIEVPAGDIVLLVEGGKAQTEEMRDTVYKLLSPHSGEKVKAIVLGCTHFVQVKNIIGEVGAGIWPSVKVIDSNSVVLGQLESLLDANDMRASNKERTVTFDTSGEYDFYKPLFDKLMG